MKDLPILHILIEIVMWKLIKQILQWLPKFLLQNGLLNIWFKILLKLMMLNIV